MKKNTHKKTAQKAVKKRENNKVKKEKELKNVPKYSSPKDLAIKRGINGLGLFAKIPIKRGECIIEYTGEVISASEANRRGGRYLFETSANRHIDGTTRKNIARYINHTCRGANCEPDTIRGRVLIYAKKNILPGEELLYDYGKEYWNEYIKPKGCLCEKCKIN